MNTLHPDLQALLNTCRNAPADDLPRLVMADWLEENDEPDRAEFIRLQCEIARPTLDTSHTRILQARERALLSANALKWIGELLQLMSMIGTHNEIYRRTQMQQTRQTRRRRNNAQLDPAAVEPVQIDPLAKSNVWSLRRGLLNVDLTHLIPHLQLEQQLRSQDLSVQEIVEWFSTPEAGWLERVNYDLHEMAVLPQLVVPEPLRPVLGISIGCDIYAQQLHTQSVDSVDLDSARTALQSDNFRYVRTLAFRQGRNQSVERSPFLDVDLSHIQQMRFHATPTFSYEPFVAQLIKKRFDQLSSLEISGLQLSPKTLKAFASSENFPQLVSLSAYRNPFGDAGMIALANSALAQTLNSIEFMNCGIGNRGMIALAKSPLFERLYGPQLNLSMNAIGDSGMKAIAESPGLLNFSELILRENKVGSIGAKAIAKSPYARNLKYLDFWKNAIDDKGAIALAKSEHLDGIHDLSLRDNHIGEAGKKALHDRFGSRAKV